MDNVKGTSSGFDRLRAKAEERLSKQHGGDGEETVAEAKKLLHELQVHQVELEMQNEELRQAQSELEDSRSRYADLYDFSPVGYITLDRSKSILEANLTAAEQLGCPRELLMKRTLTTFIVPEDRQIFDRFIDRVCHDKTHQDCEVRIKRRDDSVYHARLDGVMVEDVAGVASCRFSIADISDRRKAEQEQESLQAQLIQAQKMEAIGTLAGGIAHDFNNIMTVIKSLTSLALNKAEKDSPFRHYLEPMRDVSERGINLIQQLLIFSQHKPVEFSYFNMNDVIDDFLQVIGSLISEDITIEKELAQDLWDIKADKGRIEQVITNLVINSRDAMLMGGTITLQTENIALTADQAAAVQGAAPGNFICLTVQDTGKGIEKEVLKHIFEPFFTTKAPNGTGLGLSVVYGIVKELGGWITVESEVGHGTKFMVYLPISSGAGKTAPAKTTAMKTYDGAGRRILLVEDDKWVRKSTALVLSENGYVVFEAPSAEKAISLFYKEKGKFDLVMSDVVMPGRNGLQMISPLLDVNPKIPILLCSGHLDDKAQLEEIVRRGIPYIHKPYEIDDLLQAIEDMTQDGSKKNG